MELWRHIKSGGEYVELCRAWGHDLDPMVIYKEFRGETIWARISTEFDDGRFERIGTVPGEMSDSDFPLEGVFEADLKPCVIIIENDDYAIYSKEEWDALTS